ncbi:hypothetical protein B0H17DRAFT_1129509 [Mycena rosella]|uniref:Uncharacterized protein n=1 Tax=Mycena rosella TaxID=1033263 RepID=A0AAD7GN97_MYCRO|nr:hypothetical protein B0H17DRAFT_1129509 [Mycena rosella]
MGLYQCLLSMPLLVLLSVDFAQGAQQCTRGNVKQLTWLKSTTVVNVRPNNDNTLHRMSVHMGRTTFFDGNDSQDRLRSNNGSNPSLDWPAYWLLYFDNGVTDHLAYSSCHCTTAESRELPSSLHQVPPQQRAWHTQECGDDTLKPFKGSSHRVTVIGANFVGKFAGDARMMSVDKSPVFAVYAQIDQWILYLPLRAPNFPKMNHVDKPQNYTIVKLKLKVHYRKLQLQYSTGSDSVLQSLYSSLCWESVDSGHQALAPLTRPVIECTGFYKGHRHTIIAGTNRPPEGGTAPPSPLDRVDAQLRGRAAVEEPTDDPSPYEYEPC